MSTIKNQLSRFKFIVFILIIIIVGLLVVVANQQRQKMLPNIAIEKVTSRDVIQLVAVSGNISGLDSRSVYIPASQVMEVRVQNGDSVPSGHSLMLISVNGRNVDVTAPIAGVVSDFVYKNNDSVVNPALPALKITDVTEYRVELAVNENDIVNVKVGQPVELNFPAVSLDKTYPGEVVSVSPTPIASAGAVNYTVIVKPTDLPTGIRLGMSTDVEITTNKVTDVLAIPESYLLEKDDKFFVKLLTRKEDGEYEITEEEVTIGLRTDDYVEIKSGLSVNQEAVEPSFTVERTFGFF